MKKLMKKFDNYSEPFHFTYKGNSKHKSILGGISTIITYLLITVSTLYLGKDLYLKENPISNTHEEKMKYRPTTRLHGNNSVFALSIDHLFNKNLEREKYLTIIPSINQKIVLEKDIIYRTKILELEKCNQEIRKRISEETLPEDLMCIKDFDTYLSGGYDWNFDNYIQLQVYSCKNETTKGYNVEENKKLDEFEDLFMKKYNMSPNQNLKNFKKFKDQPNKELERNNCKTPNQIKEDYGFTIDFYIGGFKMNPFSNEIPLTPNVEKIHTYIDQFLSKTITLSYETYSILDDLNLIFDYYEEIGRKHGFANHLIDFDTIEKGILNVSLEMSDKLKTQKRTYIKLHVIYANLALGIQTIFMMFEFVMSYFNDRALNLKIINKLFSMKYENKSEKELNLIVDLKKKDINTPIKDLKIEDFPDNSKIKNIIEEANNNLSKNTFNENNAINSKDCSRIGINVESERKKENDENMEKIISEFKSKKNKKLNMNETENCLSIFFNCFSSSLDVISNL